MDTIVLTGKELSSFAKKFHLKKDRGYNYITNYAKPLHHLYLYKGQYYRLGYVSGCFYPYVFLVS